MLKNYWTITDIARIRGCDRSTVHRAAVRLDIAGEMIGATRFFNRREFNRLCTAIRDGRGRPRK